MLNLQEYELTRKVEVSGGEMFHLHFLYVPLLHIGPIGQVFYIFVLFLGLFFQVEAFYGFIFSYKDNKLVFYNSEYGREFYKKR